LAIEHVAPALPLLLTALVFPFSNFAEPSSITTVADEDAGEEAPPAVAIPDAPPPGPVRNLVVIRSSDNIFEIHFVSPIEGQANEYQIVTDVTDCGATIAPSAVPATAEGLGEPELECKVSGNDRSAFRVVVTPLGVKGLAGPVAVWDEATPRDAVPMVDLSATALWCLSDENGDRVRSAAFALRLVKEITQSKVTPDGEVFPLTLDEWRIHDAVGFDEACIAAAEAHGGPTDVPFFREWPASQIGTMALGVVGTIAAGGLNRRRSRAEEVRKALNAFGVAWENKVFRAGNGLSTDSAKAIAESLKRLRLSVTEAGGNLGGQGGHQLKLSDPSANVTKGSADMIERCEVDPIKNAARPYSHWRPQRRKAS